MNLSLSPQKTVLSLNLSEIEKVSKLKKINLVFLTSSTTKKLFKKVEVPSLHPSPLPQKKLKPSFPHLSKEIEKVSIFLVSSPKIP